MAILARLPHVNELSGRAALYASADLHVPVSDHTNTGIDANVPKKLHTAELGIAAPTIVADAPNINPIANANISVITVAMITEFNQ
jgi:hypothetical protein